MKLEVGQKIGIYESLEDDSSGKIIKGNCYLGIDLNYCIDLFTEFHKPILSLNTFFMFPEEVRKVGTLIVKKVK